MINEVNDNCIICRKFFDEECVDKDGVCMCRVCPRNLSKCILTRWCSETESPLEY